jgi:hypothetical protein
LWLSFLTIGFDDMSTANRLFQSLDEAPSHKTISSTDAIKLGSSGYVLTGITRPTAQI